MGYMDLGLKIAEITVYALCLLSLGIMKVLPWRKPMLDEKLKKCKYNYESDKNIVDDKDKDNKFI